MHPANSIVDALHQIFPKKSWPTSGSVEIRLDGGSLSVGDAEKNSELVRSTDLWPQRVDIEVRDTGSAASFIIRAPLGLELDGAIWDVVRSIDSMSWAIKASLADRTSTNDRVR